MKFSVARRLFRASHPPYTIDLDDGGSARGRTIIIAAGSRYRRLDLPNLTQFEGVGVYYGATHVEATVCRDEEVAVVGGGNSAGQAAVFLSGTAKHVYLVMRGPCLAKTMSRYLISRIEASPQITLMAWTRIEALQGDTHLKRVLLHNTKTGTTETRDVQHVFMMTGAPTQNGFEEKERRSSRRTIGVDWGLSFPPTAETWCTGKTISSNPVSSW